jgi:glyoxylase I family protein
MLSFPVFVGSGSLPRKKAAQSDRKRSRPQVTPDAARQEAVTSGFKGGGPMTQPCDARVLGAHHVAVQVRALAAAEAFYTGVLGLPVLRRWPEPDGTPRAVWLDLGDGTFLALEKAAPDAVLPRERPFRDGQAGVHLVALRIAPEARNAWETRLAAHGVEVVHRSKWTLYVRDPEGNRVGLSHHPHDA